jgi:hypothetical protein
VFILSELTRRCSFNTRGPLPRLCQQEHEPHPPLVPLHHLPLSFASASYSNLCALSLDASTVYGRADRFTSHVPFAPTWFPFRLQRLPRRAYRSRAEPSSVGSGTRVISCGM